jgi:hypothetical protein
MKAVSGLDVHKHTIFACILQKGKAPFVREYTTLTSGIKELRKDLQTMAGKTDVKDAHRIAPLLQKGLLKESFVAEGLIAELREYERGYIRLCTHESRLEQAIERQLIKCNIRIISFAIHIGSTSVMKIVKAICDGETFYWLIVTVINPTD